MTLQRTHGLSAECRIGNIFLQRVRNRYPYGRGETKRLLGVIYIERSLCPGKRALKKQTLVKDAVRGRQPGPQGPGFGRLQPASERPPGSGRDSMANGFWTPNKRETKPFSNIRATV